MLLVGFQGAGMYHGNIKKTEDDIQNILKRVNELTGIKESDTGLAPPAHWDLAADKQILQSTSHNLILLLPHVQEHNTQLENLPYQVLDGMQFFRKVSYYRYAVGQPFILLYHCCLIIIIIEIVHK